MIPTKSTPKMRVLKKIFYIFLELPPYLTIITIVVPVITIVGANYVVWEVFLKEIVEIWYVWFFPTKVVGAHISDKQRYYPPASDNILNYHPTISDHTIIQCNITIIIWLLSHKYSAGIELWAHHTQWPCSPYRTKYINGPDAPTICSIGTLYVVGV